MEGHILFPVKYIRDNGSFAGVTERIVSETALEIRIHGEHFSTAMILATMEKEFVVGHLFSQGVITCADDLVSIHIKEDVAEVTLSKDKKHEISDAQVQSDLIVQKEDVFTCVREILKSDIFAETEAVHSAGLFLNGKETVGIAEDLGRHHALDKVIGCGLLRNIDFSHTLAASTGRQPTEMINKCRNAGIPIIATKGVPTTLAIELAEKAGITIAGLVRGDTMIVYSNPARVR